MFLNTLNWYCVKRTCFWISYSLWQCLACNSSNASKAVRSSYTACYAHAELFCNISLHGERTRQSPIAIVLFYTFGKNLSAVGWPSPTRLWQN